MISLEKNISGYSFMSRMNKPNPNYISSEEGGSRDEKANPKKILLTDPAVVRSYIRYTQDICRKLTGVTQEEEHFLSYWALEMMTQCGESYTEGDSVMSAQMNLKVPSRRKSSQTSSLII